ncbi:MAG: aminomethyl-transferring glycine dehydrogenase subunit GcvPA [Spirochaetaceae bacterium]|jgi:glycine dehydrogenase subunit 1|nr:aminomethyl-transferring glycine dehydrogenase subunit GcvPA [Spirochaetaceae bacterium]
MPYIPATGAQRDAMLAAIGVNSLAEFFTGIPEELRFPELPLEEGLSEPEVLRELSALAEENTNADRFRWFLGGGLYDHFIPAAVGALASRGEFLTAYTPYQSEVSQGTLQAIFEYQTMAAELLGLDAANAGHYDGATALAEAALMALRNHGARTGGKPGRILLPRGLHPEYRGVLETYLAAFDPVIETYGEHPREAAASAGDLACLIAAYPDFFGIIPELNGAAGAVHERGGLFIIQADPVFLGLCKSPGEWGADIAVAEGQSLGNDLNYGGPGLGIMAAKAELTRRLPGRIAGEARDNRGRRGFVLTLAAREQHIRREKAVSNICSNQGLAMLRSCIYLALMGKRGLREAAELCWHKSHYAAARLGALPGFSVPEKPFFKEFTLTLPGRAGEASAKLREKGIVPGLPLSRYWPDRDRELLVCVTEKNSRRDIDELVTALGEVFL